MKRLPCIFAIVESNASVFAQFVNQLKQDGMLSGPSYKYEGDDTRWCANICITMYSKEAGKTTMNETEVTTNGPVCISKLKARQCALLLLMPLIVDLCSLTPYHLSYKGRPVGFIGKNGGITFC